MISVCMPTYNGEKYIKQQIKSILAQLSSNDELIISDDSSTDSTIEIIEGFEDKRIKLLKSNKFYSPIYNMENALKHSKGEYVFMSDQDDIWANNRVEKTIKTFKETQANLIVCRCEVIDFRGEVIREAYLNSRKPIKSFLMNLYKNPYIGCCMAFDKKALKLALPFPPQIAMHDSWIGLLTQKYGKAIYIDNPLVQYRRYEDNFTQSDSGFSFFYKIKYRIYTLVQIYKRGRCFKKTTNR